MVKVVNAQQLLVERSLQEALSTHKGLKEEDISFALAVARELKLNNDQLATVLLMVCHGLNTGRFALSYNQDLDNALRLRDGNLVRKLFNGENYLVEIYDNPRLTDEERGVITAMVERELASLQAGLVRAEQQLRSGNFKSKIAPCGDTEGACLYRQCYRKESPFMTSSLPETIYTVDKAPGAVTPTVYVFDYMELIRGLSMQPPTNPRTGVAFYDLALSLTLPRFEKEIKLYQRYLEQR